MSFRRKPESSVFTEFQNTWTPVCTGVTTSYKAIDYGGLNFFLDRLSHVVVCMNYGSGKVVVYMEMEMQSPGDMRRIVACMSLRKTGRKGGEGLALLVSS